MKRLSSLGQLQGSQDDLTIQIAVHKEAKTISVSDRSLGITAAEIKQYINQIAFSGATEFMVTFKEARDANEIIGRIGLGFYSAFMVADRVEIHTLSYQEGAEPARRICDGRTEFEITEGKRTERGTDVILVPQCVKRVMYMRKQRLQEILNNMAPFLLYLPVRHEKDTWKMAR